jgi:hypothetical protein
VLPPTTPTRCVSAVFTDWEHGPCFLTQGWGWHWRKSLNQMLLFFGVVSACRGSSWVVVSYGSWTLSEWEIHSENHWGSSPPWRSSFLVRRDRDKVPGDTINDKSVALEFCPNFPVFLAYHMAREVLPWGRAASSVLFLLLPQPPEGGRAHSRHTVVMQMENYKQLLLACFFLSKLWELWEQGQCVSHCLL